jgi:hypothetical protein
VNDARRLIFDLDDTLANLLSGAKRYAIRAPEAMRYEPRREVAPFLELTVVVRAALLDVA